MADQKLVALASRRDIYVLEDDTRLFKTARISLFLGILFGILMTILDPPVDLVPDFAVVDDFIVVRLEKRPATEKEIEKAVPKPKVTKPRKISLRPSSVPGTGKNRGGGNLLDRVSQKGLLVLLKGKGSNISIAGQAFESIKFVKDLDQVLNHIAALKTSGIPGIGRHGPNHNRFNSLYSGDGGEPGGIDELLESLASGPTRVSDNLVKKPKVDFVTEKTFWNNEQGLAGRNPADISEVVMQELGGLGSAYNKRLRAKAGLKGKITVRFAIDPAGKVLWCRVIKNTLRDKLLELEVVRRVKLWKFDPCRACGTATVTYPFAFYQ
jgi:TonB family protein